MKILVVDDSLTMRRIVGNTVVQAGFKKEDFDEAKDGQEALGLLEENSYDLVLTDWNMPVMNGLELVKTMKTMDNLKKIPIIMVTTEGAKSEVVTALKAGVNNYIVKPFTADILKEKIQAVIK
jgi:two-component system, chemotaxis family, chemotaxis protein CheY